MHVGLQLDPHLADTDIQEVNSKFIDISLEFHIRRKSRRPPVFSPLETYSANGYLVYYLIFSVQSPDIPIFSPI